MAWAVSAGTLVSGNGSSIATVAPGGVVSGDLLVLQVLNELGTTITTPSGWTQAVNAQDGNGANRHAVYYRIADGSGSDAPSVSMGAARDYQAAIYRVTGHHASTYFDTAQSLTATSGQNPVLPTITTLAETGELLMGFLAMPAADINSTPSGYTVLYESNLAANTLGSWWRTESGTGPAGGETVGSTFSGSHVRHLLAFRPASASPQTVTPSAIDPAEAFGSAVLHQAISPEGPASDGAFGSATVMADRLVLASEIGPGETFGDHTINADGLVVPTGIGPEEAFGDHLVTGESLVVPEAVDTEEDFGSAAIGSEGTIAPAGVESEGAFGSASVLSDLTVAPSAIDPAEAFGSPILTWDCLIVPEGAGSAVAFGSATVVLVGAGLTIDAGGLASPSFLGGGEAVLGTLHNDNEVYDAIVALIRGKAQFDGEIVVTARPFGETQFVSDFDKVCHIQAFRSVPQMDGVPTRETRIGSYLMTLSVRGAEPDSELLQELVRDEAIIRNALLARQNRAYGGFCLPWMSTLRPAAYMGQPHPDQAVQLVGGFAYTVTFAAPMAYSETR